MKAKEERFGRRRIRNADRTFDLFSARAEKSVRFFYHGGVEYEELSKWQFERDPFYKAHGWTIEQLVAHNDHLANAFTDWSLSGSSDWNATGQTAAVLLTERPEVLLFDTGKFEISARYRWTGGHGVALVGGESGDRYLVGVSYLGERFFERSPRGNWQRHQLQIVDRQTGEYAFLAVAGDHMKKIDGTSSVIVTGVAGSVELVDVEKVMRSMRDPKTQRALVLAEETETSRLSDVPPVARQVCPEIRPIGR